MMPPESAYRNNVAAVIMDADGYVLVGRKKATSKYLHFPQGGVCKKEKFEDALWRELREEVGLDRAGLQTVSHLAGLCYEYRKKNKKRATWNGQLQTYYLLRCMGARPVVDSRNSPEFGVLEWVHYSNLHPELFVPFKRGVVATVLNRFFSEATPDTPITDIHMHYLFTEGDSLKKISATDRSFCAGGKDDVLPQFQDLKKRIRSARKEEEKLCAQYGIAPLRTLVILHDAERSASKRRMKCLRHLAELFDPLSTEVQRPIGIENLTEQGRCFTPCLSYMLPARGEVLLTAETAYQVSHLPEFAENYLSHLADFERLLQSEGTCVLKFYLQVLPEQSSHSDFDKQTELQESVLRATAGAAPWFIVPAEKKWYRDFVIASIVAQLLEKRLHALRNADSCTSQPKKCAQDGLM